MHVVLVIITVSNAARARLAVGRSTPPNAARARLIVGLITMSNAARACLVVRRMEPSNGVPSVWRSDEWVYPTGSYPFGSLTSAVAKWAAAPLVVRRVQPANTRRPFGGVANTPGGRNEVGRVARQTQGEMGRPGAETKKRFRATRPRASTPECGDVPTRPWAKWSHEWSGKCSDECRHE